jgi:hypothetical protein
MRKKYFDWEYVFERIWNSADHDGIWDGDAATLSEEFSVTEDEAHSALSELCDRHLIECLYPGKYAISKWRDRDDTDEGLVW